MSTFEPRLKPRGAFPCNVTAPAKPAEVAPVLPMKRTAVEKRLQIGATLLREFNNPKHRNYDPTFPLPFRLTDNGPQYFDATEIDLWLQKCKRKSLSSEKAAPSSI